jgi:hypothetical protein
VGNDVCIEQVLGVFAVGPLERFAAAGRYDE